MAVTVTRMPTLTLARAAKPDDHVLVLFGVTGDLARRKLLPGLFRLATAGLLSERYRIIGSSPSELSDAEFREHARAAVEEFGRQPLGDLAWAEFAACLSYARASDDDGTALAAAVRRAEDAIGGPVRRLHYLSVPPAAFARIVELLGATGLAAGARVILEKPFGTDLASARWLNTRVREVFADEQVFRIDHFLGKEQAQNILAFRFGNGLFEPVWNRDHIDHVQIDVPEALSIEGRASFYESTGAFRDMVVTHLFQVLGFVAMEPPTAFAPKPLVDEKVKVFESMAPLRPEDVVRGQYEGYRHEPGVAPDSDTETFVALRCHIDSWRWKGVPFYLRTGKRLAEGRRTITVVFREPPLRMFPADAVGSIERNRLSFDLSDPGGISASFLAKVPGPTLELGAARMDFRYEQSFCSDNALEAYERLIHDALLGDHTLFTRADGIERLWEISAPVLSHPPRLATYAPGSWGPDAIHELISPRRWYLPQPQWP
jgi:glucose-6-phosphate 1-dehydrogenase